MTKWARMAYLDGCARGCHNYVTAGLKYFRDVRQYSFVISAAFRNDSGYAIIKLTQCVDR